MCMDKIIHVALGKKATGHLYDTFIYCVSLHLGFFRHIFFLGCFWPVWSCAAFSLIVILFRDFVFPDAIKCHHTCIIHSDMSVCFEAITVPVMHTYSLAPCAFLATSCRVGVGCWGWYTLCPLSHCDGGRRKWGRSGDRGGG